MERRNTVRWKNGDEAACTRTALRFFSTSLTRLFSSSLISFSRRANVVRLSAIVSCVFIADCHASTYDLSAPARGG